MAARDAAPVAELTYQFVGAFTPKGKRLRAQDFNRYEAAKIRIEARQAIPQRSAKVFMRLWREGRVPSWATEFVDLNFIEAAE
ncbi:MAG: hypothetical protein AAGF24_02165 [Cyanobacteria bacterium P01_H01_bin.121]